MELLKQFNDVLFTNFYVFGMTLACIFMFLVGLFTISLKEKSKSTTRFSTTMLFFGLFIFFYIISTAIYHPVVAFHRWGTVFFVLVTIVYLTQWVLHFPNDEYQKYRKAAHLIQLGGAFLVGIYFAAKTWNAPKKFHFTGHYWDFDADELSKYVGIFIQLYLFHFFFVGMFKTWKNKTKNKWVIFKMTLGFFLATAIPSALNTISRDGALDRGVYMTVFVVTNVLGVFYIVLIYFNNTEDRTTFMAKIVGISLVTFLLIMLGLSLVTMKDREFDYDTLHMEYTERAIESGSLHDDVQYILKLSPNDTEVQKPDYKESLALDLPLVKIDLLNTIIFDKIINTKEDNFANDVKLIIENSHPEFIGYKKTLLDFLNNSSKIPKSELKKKTKEFMEKLNSNNFIQSNKLSSISTNNFCDEGYKFINKLKEEIHFKEAVLSHFKDCKWDGEQIPPEELRKRVYLYFRFFRASEQRQYRKSIDGQTHFVSFTKFFPNEDKIKEVGFSYLEYRKYMHESAKDQLIILFTALLALLTIFPYFFKGSLIDPLEDLLSGVTKVNSGNLEVNVPKKVNDEIGFLSTSFNSMVTSIKDARKELQDYANNLEFKVQERTKEVQEKMEEVQKLKVQQDGDYFLTSLLTKPLFFNANKSDQVITDFVIKQKKQFQFRNKSGELGGDICVTGNLKLGTPQSFKRYTVAMNGDAMGKSMQGAGGSLVMGVVMNSIMARSAANKKIMDTTPEKWLTDFYNEVNSVFKTFNGSMVLSATVALVEDDTGKMYYWNAEHPFTVLYRDGKAEFIEDGLKLRKLGLESEYEFAVYEFQILPEDTIIFASDGRDDLDLTPGEPIRTINDDEMLFLKIVEESKGDIYKIEGLLKLRGDITDDLSILKLTYNPALAENPIITSLPHKKELVGDSASIINKLYQDGKNLYSKGDILAAKQKIEEAFALEKNHPRLNRLYGLLSFKARDYEKAAEILESFLEKEKGEEELWYYLSLSYKKIGKLDEAIQASENALKISPKSLQSMLNLADTYRLRGNTSKSKEILEEVLRIDPSNKNGKKLQSLLTE
ncbi:MAG: SpoIIE family protein phosphatase [Leptospiraceae bacterium]|nr:SpoIIE family protein phosphatase [Leptospiraceae bacterium]